MVKTIQFLGAAALAIGLNFGAQAQTGDFDPAEMRCLDFVNGQGDGATNKGRADLARIWIMGYMAGNYTGGEKLEWSDDSDAEDKSIKAVLTKCREHPEVTLAVTSRFVTSDRRRDVPNTLSNDFNPRTYMCGDHADGLEGTASDALKADLANVWAFAFVQGFIDKTAELMVPVENKPAITGSIAKNCASNREYSFFDLTALVAASVNPNG